MPIKQLNMLYQTVVTSFNSVRVLPFLCFLGSKKNSIHHLVDRDDPVILRRRPELEAANWKCCDHERENRVYWL